MENAKPNAVNDKSFAFALRVVRLAKYLQEEKREFVLSKQLLRSGTAVGALIREAEQAESHADFIPILIRFKTPAFRPELAPPRPEGRGFRGRSGGDTNPSTPKSTGLKAGDNLLKLLVSIVKTAKNGASRE